VARKKQGRSISRGGMRMLRRVYSSLQYDAVWPGEPPTAFVDMGDDRSMYFVSEERIPGPGGVRYEFGWMIANAAGYDEGVTGTLSVEGS